MLLTRGATAKNPIGREKMAVNLGPDYCSNMSGKFILLAAVVIVLLR